MKIELSEQDRTNLLAFLNRVQLQGNEAFVLAMLQQKFRDIKAVKKEKKDEKNT